MLPRRLLLPLVPALLAAVALLPGLSDACTCMIVTKGASLDGNAIVTYAADSHTLYGYLQHWPRATHAANATREIYDWDGKFYLGTYSIPKAVWLCHVCDAPN